MLFCPRLMLANAVPMSGREQARRRAAEAAGEFGDRSHATFSRSFKGVARRPTVRTQSWPCPAGWQLCQAGAVKRWQRVSTFRDRGATGPAIQTRGPLGGGRPRRHGRRRPSAAAEPEARQRAGQEKPARAGPLPQQPARPKHLLPVPRPLRARPNRLVAARHVSGTRAGRLCPLTFALGALLPAAACHAQGALPVSQQCHSPCDAAFLPQALRS